MAPEEDKFLIDVYSVNHLQDFRLGARPQIPRQATTAHAEEPEHLEGHDMDINETLVPKGPPILKDLVHQLLCEVQTLSDQQ